MIQNLVGFAREHLANHPDILRLMPGETLFENTSKATIIYFLNNQGRPFLVAKISREHRFDRTIREEGLTMERLRNHAPEDLGIPKILQSGSIENRTVLLMEPAGERCMATEIRRFMIRPITTAERHFDLAFRWLQCFRRCLSENAELNPPVHGDFGPRNIQLDRRGRIWVVDWELFQQTGNPYWDPCHFVLTYLWLFYGARNNLGQWEAWDRGLAGESAIANASWRFLARALPQGKEKTDGIKALELYGREILERQIPVATTAILRADPENWNRFLRKLNHLS